MPHDHSTHTRLDETRANRRSGLIRLGLVGLSLLVGAAAVFLSPSLASTTTFPSALAKPTCGPGALKETSIDGRVPSADYASGRYRQGYRCNTTQVSHPPAPVASRSSATSTRPVTSAPSTTRRCSSPRTP